MNATPELAKPTRFAIGDKVPEWLLTAEPVHAQSVFGDFAFDTPCDVIETADYFVVVVLHIGPLPSVLHFSGGGCRIFAPGKPVRLVVHQQVFMPADVDSWSSPVLPFVRQDGPAPTPPKKGFWARLFG